MNGQEIRTLRLAGSPDELGRAHGAAHAAGIRAYAEERIRLAAVGTSWDRGRILALAERMLAAHEAYDAQLYAEMEAMADAAGISAAEAVVTGGYTDFIDVVRVEAGGTAFEDDCTVVIAGGFLAQTWDMHASATPFVVLLDLQPDAGPAALVFTTVGCLGQIGMNEAGIAIGINNLAVTDGRVGVTWPFVVRKALAQTDFDAAVRCVLDADLAGGHSFLLLDADGRGVAIEATPTATHVERLGAGGLAHTNHCLAPATQAVEAPRLPELAASSEARLTDAAGFLAGTPASVTTLTALLRDERSICRRPEPPFDYESSGAVIMRPAAGELWACWGVPADGEFTRFALPAMRPVP